MDPWFPVKRRVFKLLPRILGDLEFKLPYRKIGLMPSGGGWVLVFTLGFLLISSLRFNLNVGYLCSFILFAFMVICAVMSASQLAHKKIQIKIKSVYTAQQESLIYIETDCQDERSIEIEVIENNQCQSRRGIRVSETQNFDVSIGSFQRGLHKIPELMISSGWPLGIWKAYAICCSEHIVVVGPKPELNPPAYSSKHQQAGVTAVESSRPNSDEAPDGLRAYDPAEGLSRLSWQVLAKTDGNVFVAKTSTQEPVSVRYEIDWQQMGAHIDVEKRLERVWAWLLLADQKKTPWSLLMPSGRLSSQGGASSMQDAHLLMAFYGATDHGR